MAGRGHVVAVARAAAARAARVGARPAAVRRLQTPAGGGRLGGGDADPPAAGTGGGSSGGVAGWGLDALRLLRSAVTPAQLQHVGAILDGSGRLLERTTDAGDKDSSSSNNSTTNTGTSTSAAGGTLSGAPGGNAPQPASSGPDGGRAAADAGETDWLHEMLSPPGPLVTTIEKKARMVLQTTEFDRNGDVRKTQGRYLKSDLCAMHQLQPRDLRVVRPTNFSGHNQG